MKKLLLALTLLLAISASCHANPFHDVQNKVGTDRFAHMAVSYMINDQLHRSCGMNKFWAAFTTIAIGAAKEKWVDKRWDSGDFAADCAGVIVYQIKF